MLKVGNAMVVTLDYTLKNDEGEVVDSSAGKQPLVYLHGAGNIIEGLEDGLEDLVKGDTFTVSVEPKKGYGPIDKRLISELPKTRFPEDAKIDVGQQFTINGPNGQRQVKVIEVKDDSAVIDGNHPLAGKTLNFSGTILDLREASAGELQHGHAHGPGGHHHH
jgi:FKBP-type peptidyl-prolyl cis-trans isomerase SlyD